MIKGLLSKLSSALINTASNHKKKLIFIAILFLGYQIARRKLAVKHLISVAMFFFKMWSKIMEIFPLPQFANYRLIQTFQFSAESDIPQLANTIQLKEVLARIKNKQGGALNELKFNVITGVLLNLMLYKIDAIYTLITRKYKMDFEQLGAGAPFEQSMALLKVEFIQNLKNFRLFIASELRNDLDLINLSQIVNQPKIKELFQTLLSKISTQVININDKVLSRRTNLQKTDQYKVAQNYFKTTKQYIAPKQSNKFTKILKFIFYPSIVLYRGISSVMEIPQQNLTPLRYSFTQYLYILPLKKFRGKSEWPNLQSKYLFGMVIDELINFFYSLNFNIVSNRRAQLNLCVFMNRIKIYFAKKQKTDSKKLMDLLPIFYKIIKQEMMSVERRKDFYERQMMNAFKDSVYHINDKYPLGEYILRNRILQQIYYNNQVIHLEKDMQAKLYNERDGLIMEPMPRTLKNLQEKDEVEDFMKMLDKADVQKETTRQQMQMMRELTQ